MPKNAPIGLKIGHNLALIMFFKNQPENGHLHGHSDPASARNVHFLAQSEHFWASENDFSGQKWRFSLRKGPMTSLWRQIRPP